MSRLLHPVPVMSHSNKPANDETRVTWANPINNELYWHYRRGGELMEFGSQEARDEWVVRHHYQSVDGEPDGLIITLGNFPAWSIERRIFERDNTVYITGHSETGSSQITVSDVYEMNLHDVLKTRFSRKTIGQTKGWAISWASMEVTVCGIAAISDRSWRRSCL